MGIDMNSSINYNFRSSLLTDEVTSSDEVISNEASTDLDVFKEEFYSEINNIFKGGSSNLLSVAVNIDNETFALMQSDPDFKQEMIDTMQADIKDVANLSVGTHMNITISEEGYSRSEITVSSSDSYSVLEAKNTLAKSLANNSFYYETLNIGNGSTTSSLAGGAMESLTQESLQRELLNMISGQQNLMQQAQSREALEKTNMFDEIVKSTTNYMI